MKTSNLLAISVFAIMLFASAFVLAGTAQAQYYYNYGVPSGSCTYHAYKLCSGNSIYWYDSCQNQQDLYYTCQGGQTCQYGQCVNYVQPIQPVQNYSNYVAYYKTACSGNSIYWYDSLGVASGLYKKCADKNSCTLDSCSENKCANTLKCDGTTCAVGSADYNTYCQTTPAPAQQNTTPTPAANIIPSGLSIAFFAKQDSASTQWQKTAELGQNSQIYFMISATNASTAQIDNVNVSANIPTEISSLGNLQVNGVLVSGDIVSGINIGSVAPQSTKLITFEGKTQTISAVSTKQATATSNVSGKIQTDSVSINFSQVQAVAAVSKAPATSGFMGFLKRWYLWILVGLVLIFLFIIVFKRLSSNV
ncbi:MAG: hypothetical protein NTY81_01990 [Candidatus Staskawiczbacteria bacterium]|nr:hypothetical protein [Candidatus Staskawiczbacteria bacterium]